MELTAEQRSEVMSIKDTALYLKFSESKVRRLVKRGVIPVAKIDGQYRFYLPMIQDWLVAMTCKPSTEAIEQQALHKSQDIWIRTIGE